MHQQIVLAANKSLSDIAGQTWPDSLQAMLMSECLYELLIFAVTIFFAIAVRGAYPGSKGKKARCASKSQRSSPRPLNTAPGQVLGTAAADNVKAAHAIGAATNREATAVPETTSTSSPAACPRFPLKPEDELLRQRIGEVVRCAASTHPPEEALKLYSAMRASGQHLRIKESSKGAGHSALEFYGALIRCAGRTEQPDLLEQILDDMALAGVARPRGVHESVMKLLAGKGHYRQALAVYDRMKADGIEPTPVTLSCLSNFAAELGELDLSLSFFDSLAAQGTPSIRAYMTVLRVHSTRQDWPRSRYVFDDMQRKGVPIDSLALNIILSTGVAAGELEASKQLLDEAQLILHPPVADVVSYNTVIKGYAQSGNHTQALGMLEAMKTHGVRPNAITFNTTIDAAVRGSKNEEAWSVLGQMRSAGISPDKFTCSILMKSLSSGATTEQIMMVLDMTQRVRGDTILLGNLFRGLLEASAKLRDTPLLMRIFAQMRAQHVYLGSGGDDSPSGSSGRRLRGRPGRPYRAGAMLRFPLAASIQHGRLEEATDLLAEALSLGVSPPAEAVESLAEAVSQQAPGSSLQTRLQALTTEHGLR